METSKVKSSDDANKDKSYTVVLYSELSSVRDCPQEFYRQFCNVRNVLEIKLK